MGRKAQKYKEIFKLKRMLEEEGIPFDFITGFGYPPEVFEKFPDLSEHYHICYPSKGKDQYMSVIEGFGSYGGEQDRLEIMGGLTPYEQFRCDNSDGPVGGLTANNVFKRIQKHYIVNMLDKEIDRFIEKHKEEEI